VPKVPDPILNMARTHHAQLMQLEKDARLRVNQVLERALGRIERDREFRTFSGLESLQASEIEILAKLTARETSGDLESALGEILEEGLLMAPRHAAAEVGAWLDFYGAEGRALNLGAISELSRTSLIEQIPASMARWGPDVARTVRNELSAAVATKQFADTTIDQIKGAIDSERWKADRIFRTELFNGYNSAHLESLTAARDVYEIPLKKSAITTFDSRTGTDSYPMHGQVRELEENFVDGDGRRFLHPPGRPNDREKEIPWINEGEDFDLISTEDGVAQVEAEKARNAELAGKAPPKPKQNVPFYPEDTFAGRRERMLLEWTNGSNSAGAVSTKEAVRLEFGLDGQTWNPHGRRIPPEHELGERARDARRTYDETQTYYSGPRAGSVKLYRGVRSDTFVEGSLEAWTDDPAVARRFAGKGGKVIVADIDTRRIFAGVDAPGWRHGRYGDQREFLIMSDPPALEFGFGDWQSGPLRAVDLDPDAFTGGPWGILRDYGGRSRLEHIPTGRTILEGAEFTTQNLSEIAQYLDRSGHFDAKGLTAIGETTLDDALEVFRVQYGKVVPDGAPGANVLEIFGERLGIVNEKLKKGKPGTWGRRTFGVLSKRAEGYELNDFRGVVRGTFGIATDKGGPGDGYFTLVHVKTGKPLFSGTRTFYSGTGGRVPIDVGGYTQDNLKHLAGKLEPYFDEATGAVLEETREDLDKILEMLADQDPETALTMSIGSNDEIDDWISEALGEEIEGGIDDDFDPFGDFAARPAPRGPTPGYARGARDSMSDKRAPELTPEQRLEDAVKEREASLRRGKYGRYSDPEFEKAVSEEVGRREREAARKRLAEFEGVSADNVLPGGRVFIPEPEAPAAPKYKPEDDPKEVKRKLKEAEERAKLEAEKRKAERLEREKREEEEAAKAEAERLERERVAAEKAAEKAAKEAAAAKEAEFKAKEAKRKREFRARKKKEKEEAEANRVAKEAEEKRIAEELAIAEAEAERLEEERKRIQKEARAARKAAKAAEEKAAQEAAKASTPEFRNAAAAETYAKDKGFATHVKMRRSYDKEGMREAMGAIDDMSDRFSMGKMFAITDQRHFNSDLAQIAGTRVSGGGPANVTAAYGADSLFIKKATFDSAKIAADGATSNAFNAARTDVPALIESMRDHVDRISDSARKASRQAAADKLEELAAQGWTSRFAISNTTERVIQHELGHRFHDVIKNVDADFDPMIRRLHADGWGTPIGKYATTIPEEYAAESMTAYVNGEHYLLPDELVKIYAKHDKRADAVKTLATQKLGEWNSGSADRLVEVERIKVVRSEVKAIQAEEFLRAQRARRDLSQNAGRSLTEAEVSILAEDAEKMKTFLGADDPANILGITKYNAWISKRNDAFRVSRQVR
jgi:hypothetical protein